jgi:hypothetical protein
VIDLSGWRLEFSNGEDDDYLIPSGTILRPAGYLVLYPLQKEMSLAEGGVIRMFNEVVKLVDQVILPKLPADTSYSLDETGTWHADWPTTPGEPNTPLELEPPPLPKWERIPE